MSTLRRLFCRRIRPEIASFLDLSRTPLWHRCIVTRYGQFQSMNPHFLITIIVVGGGVVFNQWKLGALSYRLPTLGGFRVYWPLMDAAERSVVRNAFPSSHPSSFGTSASSSASNSDLGTTTATTAVAMGGSLATHARISIPPIRMCPPLPRLCVLVGPCGAEKRENCVEDLGVVVESLVDHAGDFSSGVRLASSLRHQGTRHNLCDVGLTSKLPYFPDRFKPKVRTILPTSNLCVLLRCLLRLDRKLNAAGLKTFSIRNFLNTLETILSQSIVESILFNITRARTLRSGDKIAVLFCWMCFMCSRDKIRWPSFYL